MTSRGERDGPLLRIFEVRAKPGCVDALLEEFGTTSAAFVRDEPGNRGYFFGRCVHEDPNSVMFVSLWADLDAVKARFGDAWEDSYLPAGYDDLIEHCSIRHVDTGGGWHVQPERSRPPA